MEPRVEILLSTYNGQAFLRDQLESLRLQSYQNFFVTIRDDGSSDETVPIIFEYIKNYPDIFIFSNDQCGNLKPAKSFMFLLENSSADYVMFCDQDDIWDTDKVEKSLNKIIECEKKELNNVPVLVFTDLRLIDLYGNYFSKSFWEYQRINPNIAKDWQKLLALNVVTGCTIIMNRKAIDVSLPFSLPFMLHDQWIAVNVAKYGGIVTYIASSTISYRQHSSNVEGAHKFSFSYVLKKLGKLKEVLSVLYMQSKYFDEVNFVKLTYFKVSLNLKRFLF